MNMELAGTIYAINRKGKKNRYLVLLNKISNLPFSKCKEYDEGLMYSIETCSLSYSECSIRPNIIGKPLTVQRIMDRFVKGSSYDWDV